MVDGIAKRICDALRLTVDYAESGRIREGVLFRCVEVSDFGQGGTFGIRWVVWKKSQLK